MARKTGSKADRQTLRRQMLTLGAGVEAIAEEMQRRFGFRPREAFRHAHGWSQEEAAEQCNRASGDDRASFNGTRISEYERWPFAGRRPTLPVLTVLARAYGTVMRRLVDYDDLAAMPVRDRPALEGPPAVAEVVELLPVGSMDSQQDGSLEARTEQEVVMAAADQASEFGEWAETTNVGPVTLAQLEDATRRIAREYLISAPLPLFMRTMLLGKRVFRLLQGHQQPDQTRELYLAAGRLYALLSWMSGDLGYLGEAEVQGRTAWLCAELADHDGLCAWVLVTQSKTAFWDGRGREAAALARRGLELPRSGTAGVMLACQEADAWADLGAADEARAALHLADEAREHAQEPDDIGGLFSCGPARQSNYAASVNLRLGDPAAAIRLTQTALSYLDRGDPRAYGTVAQVYICAVRAHVMADQLDGAADALTPVLAIPPEQRLDPVTRRMREVGRALVEPRLRGSSAARALQGQVEGFCAASLPAQLPT
jgi:transcriptional regulator with XRE-family HTH domain